MKMKKERYEILHISEEGVAIVDKKTNEVYYGEFDLINRLQERIDKAIEYIKNNYDFYYGDELLEEYEKILEILGGKE